MICPNCKHENPAIHRFCGICGAELPEHSEAAGRAGAAKPTPPRSALPNASAPADFRGEQLERSTAGDRRHRSPEPQRNVGVSGPSFLGLGSEDSGYEEPRMYRGDDLYGTHWGTRVLFALIVVGVAAGLGYTQWRSNHGWSGIFERPAQPANASAPTVPPMQNGAAVPAGTPQSDEPAGSASAAANATPSSGGSAGAQPQNSAGQMPNSDAATNGGATKNSQTANAAKATASAKDRSPTAESEKSSDAPEENNGAVSQGAGPEQSKSAADGAAGESTDAAGSAAKDARSDEPVRLAEVYLEGKGVPQNCDEGVGILRAADTRGNSRAAIKLGAIYATGECVPMDRVIAYHYFSKAQQEDPGNQWVDENRAILWSNMNDDERSRAKAADGNE